jgi:hypothetical protein
VENFNRTFDGVIHGKTIELASEPGLPDGQIVSVVVNPVVSEGAVPIGDGLHRAFGGWAEDGDELDQFLEFARQQRAIRRPEV